MIENNNLQLAVNKQGYVSHIYQKNDPYKMNWVIEDSYLDIAEYHQKDKLFGHFDITINGKKYSSTEVIPEIVETSEEITVIFSLSNVTVDMAYSVDNLGEGLCWKIRLSNQSSEQVNITDFGVWASLAYVMFRDKDVLRNIHNSAAIFSSISTNYTKVNAVRRDNTGGNLGLYQVRGKTLSIGTYCDYENLFFENVSPSLDGLIFHKLILAGGYPEAFENRDWIYSKETLTLEQNETREWIYVFKSNSDQKDFDQQGLTLGHPKIEYTPLNILGETARLTIELPENQTIAAIKIWYKKDEKLQYLDLSEKITVEDETTVVTFKPICLGEHKAVVTLADGTEDFVVFNVMDALEKVIEERAAYICDSLYNGKSGNVPYAFEPVSNQGESLGKLNLVLKKNLLGQLDIEQVRKVEESAVRYVRPKWFINGDFTKPRKLYGEFYRCMDFEYIGHLFYLLSEFDDEVLLLNDSKTYLNWAADVFNLRVNPDLHEDERGKEEAQMLGVYFLYIQELLKKLKENNMLDTYQAINSLWQKVTERVANETSSYKAAITEHYYDNAGFGPTAGALSESGYYESAEKYGQLLLANIGYSNDFRGQNPDRWWEALSYMIHSLWGGVTAAATFKVFDALKDTDYLEASYRATAGILYCYDTHSTTTLELEKGMAASTYAVAGPHLNRPDLSRERFGQATFFRDGGIFARLFENDSQTPDWDMGEELVAYLESFGQKTFIIKENGSYKVINGSFEEKDDEFIFTSFAPYANQFYLIEEGKIHLLNEPIVNKRVTMKKEEPVTA
ncbi:hypothetical protein [Enterococcus mediterraneensis]|uniref:hypothetical protein n=1 Tax=Enterococcus mediterraneensis TaxID=2364791 RepID=UPI000F066186|nr:hypothetical protein [Enterococcus mediterraneensis]